MPVFHDLLSTRTHCRHDVYDLECDVWSWGVMFAELMDGGQLPYWHTYLTPVQVALAVAEEQLQPHLPESLPTDLQVIGRMACQFDPSARPSFEMVVEQLAPVVSQELQQASVGKTLLDSLSAFTSSWAAIMHRTVFGVPLSSQSGKELLPVLEL